MYQNYATKNNKCDIYVKIRVEMSVTNFKKENIFKKMTNHFCKIMFNKKVTAIENNF